MQSDGVQLGIFCLSPLQTEVTVGFVRMYQTQLACGLHLSSTLNRPLLDEPDQQRRFGGGSGPSTKECVDQVRSPARKQ